MGGYFLPFAEQLGRPIPRFDFRVTDGTSLPFPSEGFDLISMFMSAHHFEDAERVFAEAGRVARPGALLLLREHGRDDAAAVLYYDFVHAFYETVNRDEKTPEQWAADYAAGARPQYRTPAAWKALAAGAGFAFVSQTGPADDAFDTTLMVFRRAAKDSQQAT